jgi:hypothetical protein
LIKTAYQTPSAPRWVVVRCWCRSFIYITAQLETPREGYDEHSSKSSLSCKTKVYQTSRRKNQTSERWCPLALQHSGQWRQKTCRRVAFHQQQRGTCTQHNQVLCPNSQWGCQSHRFAMNKGLSVSSGKR